MGLPPRFSAPAHIASMRPDTQSYWHRHMGFPNQSTGNQFFSEEQLEACRELGLRIARTAIADISQLRAPLSPSEKLLQDFFQV